jgi:hypothetical protein
VFAPIFANGGKLTLRPGVDVLQKGVSRSAMRFKRAPDANLDAKIEARVPPYPSAAMNPACRANGSKNKRDGGGRKRAVTPSPWRQSQTSCSVVQDSRPRFRGAVRREARRDLEARNSKLDLDTSVEPVPRNLKERLFTHDIWKSGQQRCLPDKKTLSPKKSVRKEHKRFKKRGPGMHPT